MKLVIPQIPTPLTIDPPQLRLQVQAPDLRVISDLITMQGQAVDNGIEHRLGDQWTMEWSLSLDGRRLLSLHPGSEEQGPHPGVAGQRTDTAFDTRHQAQALAGEAEVAHGGVPSVKPCSARKLQAVSILNADAVLSSSIEDPQKKMENRR